MKKIHISRLTGQPSDIYFKLSSVILEHDCKLIAANLTQFLLIDCVDISVIFLHSDKSKFSMLGQWNANVLQAHKNRLLIVSGRQ